MKIELFYQSSCQHNCPRALEFFEKLEKKFPKRKFIKHDVVNVTQREKARKQGIGHVPAILINKTVYYFPFDEKEVMRVMKKS